MSYKIVLFIAVIMGFFVCSEAKADSIRTGYLYVADYGASVMNRYEYTYNETENLITGFTPFGYGGNTSSAVFIGSTSAPVKEGVIGTANDLIVVGGSHGSATTVISRYSLDGDLIGTIPVDFSSYNSGNVGIGNIAVTNDGRYLYAPLSSGNAIVKVDLTNGSIAASYSFSQAHDVLIDPANGNIYAANYTAASASIILLDSNLNKLQDVVTKAASGFSSFRPTGLSFAPDGSLYVQNNVRGGPDSVLHYRLSNSSGTVTATLDAAGSYIGSSTNNALEFTFGTNFGPDGKLYISDLAGGTTSNSFNSPSGYVDGVYSFDPSNNAVARAIAGFTNTSGPSGLGGLIAPKYLEFDTNFIAAGDAGVAPEPATWLLMAGALTVLIASRRTTRSLHTH